MTDPLFGPGIRMSGAWASHVSAAAQAGFWVTARTVPRLARFSVRMAWSADRWALAANAAAQLVHALVGALGLFAVNEVLLGLLASGPTPARVGAAIPALLAVGAFAATGSLAQAIATAAEGRLAPKVQRLAEQRLLEKVARAELAVLEDGEFHRTLAGARLGVRATEQLTATVLSAAGSLLGFVTMVGVVGVLHPLLLPMLVLAAFPQAWKAVTVARWEYVSAVRSLNGTRQKEVLADVLIERGAPAEEIRVHGLADFLLGHYRRLAATLESERTRLAKAQAGLGLAADAAGGAARALAYVALGWLLVSGTVALATAGTALLAISRVTTQLTSFLLQFNRLYAHGLFVADYKRTLEQVAAQAIPTGGRVAPAHPARIELRDVHFTYQGSAEPALRGVDLTLRQGEVIALVGMNGSGKTTLARLIAGLHRPGRGTIRWDAVDVNEIDRDTLFSRIAWIGQDFPRWPFTARVNTILGRPGLPDQDVRLARAAQFAGAQELVSGLPDGWDTLLAQDFQGGTNLSGGQWQRLALARGHFRDAQILICDEPTAALDPMTEIESFERLMSLAGHGQTVVLITHRLGSVRHADRIYVLDAGLVTETGTHEELMGNGGLFARMFEAQRGQYERSQP